MKQIPLSQGKFAFVDDDDFNSLNQYKWTATFHHNTWYAVRFMGRRPFMKQVYMHREIMGTPKGLDTDHIDRDGLNNQRSNLRVCTHAHNQGNQKLHLDNLSGFKGVDFDKRKRKWRARIVVNYKSIHLGYFSTPEDGAHAYDKAAREHFGEFARLNFP